MDSFSSDCNFSDECLSISTQETIIFNQNLMDEEPKNFTRKEEHTYSLVMRDFFIDTVKDILYLEKRGQKAEHAGMYFTTKVMSIGELLENFMLVFNLSYVNEYIEASLRIWHTDKSLKLPKDTMVIIDVKKTLNMETIQTITQHDRYNDYVLHEKFNYKEDPYIVLIVIHDKPNSTDVSEDSIKGLVSQDYHRFSYTNYEKKDISNLEYLKEKNRPTTTRFLIGGDISLPLASMYTIFIANLTQNLPSMLDLLFSHYREIIEISKEKKLLTQQVRDLKEIQEFYDRKDYYKPKKNIDKSLIKLNPEYMAYHHSLNEEIEELTKYKEMFEFKEKMIDCIRLQKEAVEKENQGLINQNERLKNEIKELKNKIDSSFKESIKQ